jgi:predicted transport protein
MADIKLFNIQETVKEIPAETVELERDLQNKIEANMEAFFSVTFLKSEHVFNGGRIDSLGIDENNSPVIFEYKRSMNENVINQGLFYLDWLMDHKADFELLVQKDLGIKKSEMIEWSNPVVYCIARDFTRYDEHAVNQMQRNIKLVRYRKYAENLMVFEFLNNPVINLKTPKNSKDKSANPETQASCEDKYSKELFSYRLSRASKELKDVFSSMSDFILSLDSPDEIVREDMRFYAAFRKSKNFATALIQNKKIILFLHLDPLSEKVPSELNPRDMSKIGHLGTGNLELTICNQNDLESAKPLIRLAYEKN